MSQRRSQTIARRKSKLRKQHQDEHQQRSNIARILTLMGLRDQFKPLTEARIRALRETIFPRPRVVPDPESPHDGELARKARELQRELDDVHVMVRHVPLSFNDYYSVCLMLHRYFRRDAIESRTRTASKEFLLRATDTIESFVDRYGGPLEEAYAQATYSYLIRSSRFDTAIYTARHEESRTGRRLILKTVLRKLSPRQKSLQVNGTHRRAFLCGAQPYKLRTGEVDWVHWDSQVLNQGTTSQLPVYVQSHALRQAELRLGIESESLVHCIIWSSLREPRLLPAGGGSYLVECRIGEHKVGYLVADHLDDCVLVRTFLLLTMQGTPEGTEVSRRLRLQRPDINYLGLDQLGTLVATDLTGDAQIVELLRECGCGDLLELAPYINQGKIIEGYVARFRSYLGQILKCTPPTVPSTSPPPRPPIHPGNRDHSHDPAKQVEIWTDR